MLKRSRRLLLGPAGVLPTLAALLSSVAAVPPALATASNDPPCVDRSAKNPCAPTKPGESAAKDCPGAKTGAAGNPCAPAKAKPPVNPCAPAKPKAPANPCAPARR